MAKIIVGYKAKKDINKGMEVESEHGFFEPIYADKNPIDELADYAYMYARFRGDMDLVNTIDKIVDKIKGSSLKAK